MKILKPLIAFSLFAIAPFAHAQDEDNVNWGEWAEASLLTPIRIEARESFGGCLVHGIETIGSPDGVTLTQWDTMTLANGWHTQASGTQIVSLAVVNSSTIAIEEGRLTSDTTWSADTQRLLRNHVVIPNGVTLTIAGGSIIKFTEDTQIVVEDGGKLVFNDSAGNDVWFAQTEDDSIGGNTDMRDAQANWVTAAVRKFPSGSVTEHGYVAMNGNGAVTLDTFISVSLNDAQVIEHSGKAYVPVTINGTRNAAFSIDWIAEAGTATLDGDYTLASGTIEWTGSSQGTKYIEIPLVVDGVLESVKIFTVRITASRSINVMQPVATVTLLDSPLVLEQELLWAGDAVSESSRVDLRVSYGGRLVCGIETISDPDGSVVTQWDTTTLADGWHTQSHGEQMISMSVINSPSVSIKEGRMDGDATWADDAVHVIRNHVIVPSGVVLTITSGAVIKFTENTSILVETGGILNATGVIFTHIADDAVGGDTNADENRSVPISDQYSIEGAGQLLLVDCDFRFRTIVTQQGGTLASSEIWPGNCAYRIINDITIPNGVTLTILDGAIIKFEAGKRFLVNAGGSLNVNGTLHNQVVFTSIKDDMHGGDTNKDGNATIPQAGDWHQIACAGGTVNINYAKVLYCSAQNNQGALYMTSGSFTFNNSIVAHCMYDCARTAGGTFESNNSIFTDSSIGFAPSGGSSKLTNCILYDLTTAVRWPNATFINCIISQVTTAFIDTSFNTVGLSFKNCVFWNEPGSRPQSCSYVGLNNNIWADPMFRDSDIWDFTLKIGSPCIDAADGSMSPERDYFGQQRATDSHVTPTGVMDADGAYPDIGIYEMTENAVSDVDLAVSQVAIPASANAGDTIQVSYIVTNVGSLLAQGISRDEFTFVGSYGALKASASAVSHSLGLEPGESVELTANITVPALTEGDWHLQILLNSDRTIFEGQNTNNNLYQTPGVMRISMAALNDTTTAVISGNSSQTFRVEASASEAGTMLIYAPAGLNIYGALGYVPGVGQSDMKAVYCGDGVYAISIPQTDGSLYLTIENTTITDKAVQIEKADASLSTLGVSTKILPSTGQVTFSIYGSGFTDASTVQLQGSAQTILPKSIRCLSSVELSVTVALENATAGSYDLIINDGLNQSTYHLPLQVTLTAIGPRLEAKLVVPTAIRTGRITTGWIDYANTGDTDMLMPLFIVRGSAQTLMSDSLDEEFKTNPIYMAGLGSCYPVGILKAGESGQVPFFFMAQGSGSAQFTLSYSLVDSDVLPYHEFASRQDYFEALSDAATRFDWLGCPEARINKLVDYVLTKRAGAPSAAISGFVRNSVTNEPISGVTVYALLDNGVVRSAMSNNNGFFLLDQLRDGVYSFQLNGAIMQQSVPVSVTGQADIAKIALNAIPYGGISGKVNAADTGVPLVNVTVSLLEGGVESGKVATTDQSGRFHFDHIADGTYSVIVASSGGYVGDVIANVMLTAGSLNKDISFMLMKGGVVGGRVTWNGASASGGIVRATSDDGAAMDVLCSENGAYIFDGIPPATYTFNYISNEWVSDGISITVVAGEDYLIDLNAKPRPMFIPERTIGFGELTTSFRFVDSVKMSGVLSWRWDFGDGSAPSTEAYPSHTYTSLGDYTVTLEIEESGGKRTVSIFENCVQVKAPIPNVLNINAFIVDDVSGLQCISASETDLVLQGIPPFTIVQGTVILAEHNGIQRISKVNNVTQSDDLWQLTTEEADIDELYNSYSFSTLTPLSVEEASPVQGRQALLRGLGGEVVTFIGGSISVTSSPDLYLECVGWKDGGQAGDKRLALVGSWLISASAEFKGSVTGRLHYKKPISTQFPAPFFGITLGPKFTFGVEGNLEGQAVGSWNGSINPTIRLGFEIKKGANGKNVLQLIRDISLNPDGSCKGDYGVNGSMKLYIEPAIEAKVAGISSLSVGGELYAKLEAGFSRYGATTINMKLGAAITGEASAIDVDWKIFKLKAGTIEGRLGYEYTLWSMKSPAAEFKYSPQTGDSPLTVNFTDKSKAGTWKEPLRTEVTYPISYNWDLGIASSSQNSPAQTYINDGAYKVILNVAGGPINPIGGIAEGTVHVGQGKPPPNPENVAYSTTASIPQSCDPNEMAGPAGAGEQRYVLPGEWLDFKVYFENMATATGAAQEVHVNNALSEYLDWSSFELAEVSFANQIEMGLRGLKNGQIEVAQKGTSTKVRVEASYNESTGKVYWYMRSVDPSTADKWPLDPYAGFLLPNDDTGRGEGYVAYRIKVKADAPHNARIDSSADIIFDYNEVIVTDPAWFNTVYAEGLTAPEIATQPSDATKALGASASFTVAATGYEPMSYQWYKDGVALDGQTSATLTLPSVLAGDAGEYTVTVTNIFKSITSEAASLTVVTPPEIAWAPNAGNQTVQDGATATFTVDVTAGSAPFTYAWFKNNTLISSATTASYTTPATLLSDNGAVYKVEVTNAADTASLNATLTVVASPATIADQYKSQIEDPGTPTVTISGTVDFSLVGGITIPSGKTIEGADASSTIIGGVTIPAGASGSVIIGINFTEGTLTINGASDVEVTHCTFTDTPVTITDSADNISFSWNEFTATGGGSGSAMTISNAGAGTGILLHNNLWGDGLKSDMPDVTNARVYMYNNCFTATGNTTATVAGAGAQILSVNNIYEGTHNPLTTQSTGLLHASGNSMISTTGTTAPGNDEVFVPSYSHIINPADTATISSITANAGNTAGKNSSTPAQMSGAAGISATVTGSGANKTNVSAHVPAMGGFTLASTASGFAPAARQWYLDNFAIAGATSGSYAVVNANAAAHAGTYAVALTAGTGEIVTSGAFTVTVGALAPPVITSNPVSKTINVGGSATFTVVATGESLSYQWRKGGSSIAGATGASHAITNAQQSHAGNYSVLVMNPSGTATSSAATLTVTNTSGTGGNNNSGGGGGGGGAVSLWWLAALAALAGARFVRRVK